MTARIERAGVVHAEGWAVLRARLWPEESLDAHRAEIRAWLAAPDRAAFVAVEGEAVVGFAEASIRHDHVNGCETSPAGFLEGIAVDEAHRRAGIARRLTIAVADWVRAAGCTELGSDADAANADGHALHRRLGFEERERVVFYRKLL